MQQRTGAIVLSALKYGDSSLIVRLFTADYGLQTYLLKGILTSKRGGMKAAHFQVLTQLEIIGKNSGTGGMGYLKEARIQYAYTQLHTDIHKRTMALFLSEMLSNSIREEEANPALFAFVTNALQWLDIQEHTANFHVFFLLELTKFLGFYPDTGRKDLPFFDLLEGEFILNPGLHPVLTGHELSVFSSFLGINFDAIATVKLSNEERRRLLETVVLYFEVHLHGFKRPRSLKILHEVFN